MAVPLFLILTAGMLAVEPFPEAFEEPQVVDLSAEMLDMFGARTVQVVFGWGMVFLFYLAIGTRQRREGRGSLGRLAWVSGATATMAISPLLVGVLIAVDDAGAGLPALLATLVTAVLVSHSLRPAVQWNQGTQSLTLVDDQEFLNSVKQLTSAMRLRFVPTRLLTSYCGTMETQAFAGGLPAPSLVVSDGIFQRLSAEEREAIVAHELAHVANGSLWIYPAMWAVAGVACVVLGEFSAHWYLYGLALAVGLRRIVNRPIEYDCDLRAARLVGFRTTATALAKLHTRSSIGGEGWLPALFFATATHPSLELRLHHLAANSPADDRPELDWPETRIRFHSRVASAALLMWLSLLLCAWCVEHFTPLPMLGGAPLLAAAAAPTAIAFLAVRGDLSRRNRQLGQSLKLWRWAAGILAVGAVIVNFQWGRALGEVEAIALWGGVGVLFVILIVSASSGHGTRLLNDVRLAIQQQDLERVLELAEAQPRQAQRNPLVRHNVALAEGLTGDRRFAIEELKQLRVEKPKQRISAILLAAFCLEEGLPAKALQVTRELVAELPDDSTPHILAARALHQMQRLDEAWDEVQQAFAVDERGLGVGAIAAHVAFDQQDLPRARQLIAETLEREPGDPHTLLVQAHLALSTQTVDEARAAVETALRTIAGNPFLVITREAAELRERFEALKPGPTDVEF